MGDFSGTIAFKKYFFERAYKMTQNADLQISVHANGDRAQESICAAIAGLGGSAAGRTRVRIEHAGNFLPLQRTADAWAEAGIIPVPQPVFIYTFGEYFPDYLGDYGRKGRFPFKTLSPAAGGCLAVRTFGSVRNARRRTRCSAFGAASSARPTRQLH